MSKAAVRRLMAHLMREAEVRRVTDVRFGLKYTAVRLDDGGVGLAFAFREEPGGPDGSMEDLERLAGRPVAELLSFLESDRTREASVGLAAANALVNRPRDDYLAGDVLDIVTVHPDDRVGVIGHFQPVLPRLDRSAAEVLVFEKKAGIDCEDERLRPAEEAAEWLPSCQVALITATSLINHTADELFDWAADCREVVLLGASTPMCPAVFRDTPVTVLSGAVVRSADDLLNVVSEGGGTRKFKGLTAKVNFRIKPEGV